jgi:hypothetical protein
MKSDSPVKGVIDMKLSDLSLHEWITNLLKYTTVILV